MRHSENERGAFKRKCKNRAQLQKKKENIIIAARKNISPESADRLKLIMRKLIISKKNENERFKKSLS
jgi:hypothetical protein